MKVNIVILLSLTVIGSMGQQADQLTCVCVPSNECTPSDSSADIVETRNRFCQSGEVCCVYRGEFDPNTFSEDEFTKLLNNGGLDVSTDATTEDNCICIHEDRCNDPEQSLFSLVRIGGNRCKNPLHVCCQNPADLPKSECSCVHSNKCLDTPDFDPRIKKCIMPQQKCCYNITEEPLVTDPKMPETCVCVHEDDCYDEHLDLFLNVNVRSRMCSMPFHVCCKDTTGQQKASTATTDPPPSPYDSPNCGVRHPTPISIDLRVAGGKTASEGEYPWMVAIMKKNKTGQYDYACGGSLIHPSVVLTVAHCITGDDDGLIQVRIGELDLSGWTEILGHAEIYITGKILHPYFSRRSLRYDVGLLFLEEWITPSLHINTICLPLTRSLKAYQHNCYSTGWGKDKFGDEGRYQSELKKINLPLVPHRDCQSALRTTTQLGPKFKLHRTFVCAGGEGKDTCSGDGGSPLVCPLTATPKKYVQIGAVAWGVGCGTVGVPGVYASIESSLEWIVTTVNNNYGQNSSDWFTI